MAVFSGETSSIDAFRRIAEVFELHITYDRLAEQCTSNTSKCGTWGSLAQALGDDNINLQALSGICKQKFNLLKVRLRLCRKIMKSSLSSGTNVSQK